MLSGLATHNLSLPPGYGRRSLLRAKRMRRRTRLMAIALFCIIASSFGISSIIRASRQRQFESVRELVQSNGGQLSFDLVDGNYMLYLCGDAASDDTIKKLLPALQQLPTGFTLVGPGESRQFWVSLECEFITDAGLDSLCTLEISWLTLSGGSISDISAARLSKVGQLHGIILNAVKLSESAVATLRSSNPTATVEIHGASE